MTDQQLSGWQMTFECLHVVASSWKVATDGLVPKLCAAM